MTMYDTTSPVVGAVSLVESGGTALSIGSVPDNSFLWRDGSNLVGVAMSAAGSFAAYDGTDIKDTIRAWGIATTPTIGAGIKNTTPATAGTTIQYSPAFELGGTIWDGAASKAITFRQQVEPYAGGAQGRWKIYAQTAAGGAWTELLSINHAGLITSASYIIASNFVMGASSNFGLYRNNSFGGTGLDSLSAYGGLDCYLDDLPIILYNRKRANSAGNTAVASIYKDPANETIDAGFKIHSFGTTNGTVYTESAYFTKNHMKLPTIADIDSPPTGAAGLFAYCANGDAGLPCLVAWDPTNTQWVVIDLDGATAAASS